jgi:uncharacterized protein
LKRVINSRNNLVVVEALELASTLLTRMIGLMGRKTLSSGQGMLITRSGNSIHTSFMRFPIDVAFVTKAGEVKYLRSDIKPWRLVIAPLLTPTDCLELPAGTLKKCDTRLGDILRVED